VEEKLGFLNVCFVCLAMAFPKACMVVQMSIPADVAEQ